MSDQLTARSSGPDGYFALVDTLNRLSGVPIKARPGPRTTYRFSREFKATAVRLSQIPGVAVGEVAESHRSAGARYFQRCGERLVEE